MKTSVASSWHFISTYGQNKFIHYGPTGDLFILAADFILSNQQVVTS